MAPLETVVEQAARKQTGPPTREIGAQSQQSVVPAWSHFIDEAEYAPELTFPTSILTYHKMRSDTQIDALHLGTVQPVREMRWLIRPNGADAKLVDKASRDLGLPVQGSAEDANVERSTNKFDFDAFLSDSLLGPLYGFMHFEIVGTNTPDDGFRMKKLAPRHPRTISDLMADPSGDLFAIRQRFGRAGQVGLPEPIMASNLVDFTWRPEAGTLTGRALDPETPIPTPDGWRTMGDLNVGDRIFDESGAIRHVTARADWEDRPCYEVEFSSGEVIVADAEHQWLSYHYKQRHLGGEPELVTTREMAQTVEKYGQRSNHAMPMAGPLDYVRQHLLIDPYVLGFWLGDGTSTAAEITTMDPEVVVECERRGHPATKRRPSPSRVPGRADHYALAGDLQRRLRVLGLLGNKHVPEQYLRGDHAQRLDLLRGLMDSDGNVGGKNGQRAEFCNTNRALSEAVLELARGLGGRASMTYVERGVEMVKGKPTLLKPTWKVGFHVGPLVPFLLARKVERYKRRPTKSLRHHYVRAVRLTSNRATVCIETDAPSHLFLAGRSLVATHNSMLRSMYREWLIKDRVIRIAAINLERAGGVPVAVGPQGASKKQLEELAELARQFKVSEGGGGAIPFGSSLTLQGGSVPDAIALLKYCDEAMARVWALMLLQLGATATGSRALGGEFATYAARAQRLMAKWVATGLNSFLDRYTTWNDPFATHAPMVVYETSKPEGVSVTDLVALIDAGLLTVDPELESWLRTEYALPKKPQGFPAAGEQAAEADPATGERKKPNPEEVNTPKPSKALDPTSVYPTLASTGTLDIPRIHNGIRASLTLPDRPLRRDPSENEIRAAVDFRGLDNAHIKATADLHALYLDEVLPEQIKALGAQVRAGVAARDLAAPLPSVEQMSKLYKHLEDATVAGARSAIGEAQAQGVTGIVFEDAIREASVKAAAQADHVAQLNANGLSLGAQRHAGRLLAGHSLEDSARLLEEKLTSQKHVYERENLKGAVTQAQNAGRIEAFETISPETGTATYEASELLDDRTCDPCEAVDGTVFESLEEAEAAYASGGYVDCEGGPNCRGTLVAIYPEQNPEGGGGRLNEAQPGIVQPAR
jgi:hypothetical protein